MINKDLSLHCFERKLYDMSKSVYTTVLLLLMITSITYALTAPRQFGPQTIYNRFTVPSSTHRSTIFRTTSLMMAQVSDKDAKVGIDKVVSALRKDRQATSELGKLTKVNNILGFGSPKPGTLAVRFNASFQKGGMGRSSIPLPFGLGQSNESEGRGTMVGQVKASLNADTGKLISCSVFRDLGYGRSFELKV